MKYQVTIIAFIAFAVVSTIALSQSADIATKEGVLVARDGQKPQAGVKTRSVADGVRRVFSPRRRDDYEFRNEENEAKDVSAEHLPGHAMRPVATQTAQETVYLKEIASVLSISVSEKDTPGDIAFKIRQRLARTDCYRGGIFSDASFAKAKSAIRIPSDAETFAEYHAFIKKVARKKVLIFEVQE